MISAHNIANKELIKPRISNIVIKLRNKKPNKSIKICRGEMNIYFQEEDIQVAKNYVKQYWHILSGKFKSK